MQKISRGSCHLAVARKDKSTVAFEAKGNFGVFETAKNLIFVLEEVFQNLLYVPLLHHRRSTENATSNNEQDTVTTKGHKWIHDFLYAFASRIVPSHIHRARGQGQ